MRLIVRDIIFDIEDIYISYSPFLSTMLGTDIPVDMIEDGYVIDADPILFQEYSNFLKGEEFQMDGEIAVLFDFMGHTNTLEYPLDVWRMKLRDNWIRDNFYRLELWKDPYYGLKEVPIVNTLGVELKHGFFIAGGAALWMAGVITKFSDIDIFTTLSEDEANKHLLRLNKNIYYPIRGLVNRYILTVSGHSISYRDTVEKNGIETVSKIQYILRLYKSPSEIIHGFDLDCVGILYDGSKLWATDRCLMSIRERMNWLDPTRSSPSYVHRLLKYKRRMFNIYLPHFDKTIMRGPVTRFIDDTMSSTVTAFRDKVSDSKGYIDHRAWTHMFKGTYIRDNSEVQGYDDPVSLLILGLYYNIYYVEFVRCSDYEIKPIRTYLDTTIEYERFKLDTARIRWKKQNPMEQVTSTFHPIPIKDLQEWYRTSPFYQ